MNKNIIFLTLGIFLLNQLFSQQDSVIFIRSALEKKTEFKDTISKKNHDLYKECLDWKLSTEDAYKIFGMMKSISSEAKAGLYNWLPCYFESKVLFNGCVYTMEINAASFIVLYNKWSTLYFGCQSAECKNYFILPGGNASGD